MNSTGSRPAHEQEASDLATVFREVKAHDHQVQMKGREALDHARLAGKALLRAKEKVKHGEWVNTLKKFMPGQERMARCYMQIAENWPEIEAKSTGPIVSIDAALKLLANPKPGPASQEMLTISQEAALMREHMRMPEPSPEFELRAVGDSGDAMEITPSREHPGYYYVAHYEDIHTDNCSVIYTRRPIRADVVPFYVDRHFKAEQDWLREPFTDMEMPWYIRAPGTPGTVRHRV